MEADAMLFQAHCDALQQYWFSTYFHYVGRKLKILVAQWQDRPEIQT